MIAISEDADLEYALSLQQELDQEERKSSDNHAISSSKLSMPISVVDDSWELIDPVPDARQLFLQFNDVYFNGLLASVEVRWSPRMTLCAGLCCYEGRGGLCSIRLSEPLLKLRPRKDLVQTLLHEMIHALLFVTQNNKDHDAHGPEFHKYMQRINAESGAKITVYHNFHDEVDVYRQHWWKCNGPCQKRPPYYGMVKRAINRAPSPRDPWWPDHQRTCGGTYTKIKEPENYGAKKSKGKGKSEFKTLASQKNGNVMRGNGDSGALPKFFKRKTRDSGIESGNSEEEHETGKKRKMDSFDNVTSANDGAIKPKINEAGSSRSAADVIPFSGVGRTLGSSSTTEAGSGSLVSKEYRKKSPNEETERGKTPLIVIKTPSPTKPNKRVSPTFTIMDAFQRAKQKTKACENTDDTHASPLLGSQRKPIMLEESPSTVNPGDVGSNESVHCPVCRTLVLNSEINQHLDSCLNLMA